MSASMIAGYTGLLENQQVTQVARILDVPLVDGAITYGAYRVGGPTESISQIVPRDALFDLIKAHQNDTQTEGEVFALLGRWNEAIAHESSENEGLRGSVGARKDSVRTELRVIYPMYKTTELRGDRRADVDIIGGR